MKAKTEFIIGVNVFLLGVALFASALWFAWHANEIQKSVGAAAAQVEEEGRRSAYALSVRSLLRDVAAEREVLMGITDNRDIVAFVQLVEETSKKTGTSVSVDAVSLVGKDAVDQTLEEFIVSLRAEGEYQEIMRFVSLLEAIPHPLYIEQALIENIKTGWEGSFRVRVYLDSEELRLSDNT